MNNFHGFLSEVADVVLPALASINFALGGGNGLRFHGVTIRPSDDLDTYTQDFEASSYALAEQVAVNAIREAGWNIEVTAADSFFRSLRVWKSDTDRDLDGIGIDIGQEYRSAPAEQYGRVLVLTLDDIASGKCRVLWEQGRAQDFADVAHLLVHPGWDFDRVYRSAKRAIPTITVEEFRRLLSGIDRIADDDLIDLQVDPEFVRSVLGRAASDSGPLTFER